MEEKDDCIFCRIIEKKADASFIYEDDIIVAFMDIQPVNPGHILVVPKKHLPSLDTETSEIGAHLIRAGLKIKEAFYKADIECEGVNYFMAEGTAAGQEVFHAHLHLFPRFKNDGFGFRFSEEYYTAPDRSTLDRIAKDIKKHLA